MAKKKNRKGTISKSTNVIPYHNPMWEHIPNTFNTKVFKEGIRSIKKLKEVYLKDFIDIGVGEEWSDKKIRHDAEHYGFKNLNHWIDYFQNNHPGVLVP